MNSKVFKCFVLFQINAFFVRFYFPVVYFFTWITFHATVLFLYPLNPLKYQKTKIFRKTNIACAYQGVRTVCFSEILGFLMFSRGIEESSGMKSVKYINFIRVKKQSTGKQNLAKLFALICKRQVTWYKLLLLIAFHYSDISKTQFSNKTYWFRPKCTSFKACN